MLFPIYVSPQGRQHGYTAAHIPQRTRTDDQDAFWLGCDRDHPAVYRRRAALGFYPECMNRFALTALFMSLTLLAGLAWAQEDPAVEPGDDQPAALSPVAGLIVHREPDASTADPSRLRTALAGLDSFGSLDDAESVAALVRIMVEAAAIPNSSVALVSIDAGVPVVIASVPVERAESDLERAGNVHSWSADGQTHLLYHRGDAAIDPAVYSTATNALQATFATHRSDPEAGLELMLDLENFRRAWPDSLVDGPARRVVGLSGLSNARKIRVHVPDSGVVRLSYSSRSQTPDKITTRVGPSSAVDGQLGARWPNIFDAGLRMYALALDEAARQAFTQRFQTWMGTNGNRLRGLIQATEIAMRWSAGSGLDSAPGLSVTIPIRDGVDGRALLDAASATLRDSGFEVEGNRAKMAMPGTLSDALGGQTLVIEVDTDATPTVYRILVE